MCKLSLPFFPPAFSFSPLVFPFPRTYNLCLPSFPPCHRLHTLHPHSGIHKPLDFLLPFSSHQSNSLLIHAVPHHCSASKCSRCMSQCLGIKAICFSPLPMGCWRDTIPFSRGGHLPSGAGPPELPEAQKYTSKLGRVRIAVVQLQPCLPAEEGCSCFTKPLDNTK